MDLKIGKNTTAAIAGLVLVGIIILVVWLSGQNKKDEDFSKTLECGQLINSLEQKTKKEYDRNDSMLSRTSAVTKVFYSPARNSCLYTLELDVRNNGEGFGNKVFDLRDALTNELIESEYGSIQGSADAKNSAEAYADFIKKVQKYE